MSWPWVSSLIEIIRDGAHERLKSGSETGRKGAVQDIEPILRLFFVVP
jgi:hypothetical protein